MFRSKGLFVTVASLPRAAGRLPAIRRPAIPKLCNTGGAYIEKDHQASFIRGEGVVKSIDDIRSIVVKSEGGVPVTVGDMAEILSGLSKGETIATASAYTLLSEWKKSEVGED